MNHLGFYERVRSVVDIRESWIVYLYLDSQKAFDIELQGKLIKKLDYHAGIRESL